MKQTVLVLGGTSFIGSKLIERLISLGYGVIAGFRPNSPRINNLYNKYEKNIQYLEIDIFQMDFNTLCKDKLKDIDCTYLASWNGSYNRNDTVVNKQSADGLLNCVEYILDNSPCKKIIQLGTQAEYGCIQGTVTEETICNPVTPYGKEKLRFYKMADLLCRQKKISLIEYRLHSVFGKGMGGMLGNVMSQLITNKYFHMNTDCTQIMDYIYIDDCINALILAITRDLESNIYNISSGDGYTLKDYLEIVRTTIGSECKIEYGTYKDKASPDFIFDSTKFRHETGWKPKYSFKDGIKDMLNQIETLAD